MTLLDRKRTCKRFTLLKCTTVIIFILGLTQIVNCSVAVKPVPITEDRRTLYQTARRLNSTDNKSSENHITYETATDLTVNSDHEHDNDEYEIEDSLEMLTSNSNNNRIILKPLPNNLETNEKISTKPTIETTTTNYETTTLFESQTTSRNRSDNIRQITRLDTSTTRARSYNLHFNESNKIFIPLKKIEKPQTETTATSHHSMLNGAAILAFANIEESSKLNNNTSHATTYFSSSPTEPTRQKEEEYRLISKPELVIDASNNTLKSLTDWTQILRTIEANNTTLPEPTGSTSGTRITSKIDTSSTTVSQIDVSTIENNRLTTGNDFDAGVITGQPSKFHKNNILPIDEVYRKKSNSMMVSNRPSSRIDVYEYYRTETIPVSTTVATTEEIPTTTTIWPFEKTTVDDKKNAQSTMLETITSFPYTTRRQNYRFTTMPDYEFTTPKPHYVTESTQEIQSTMTTQANDEQDSSSESPIVTTTINDLEESKIKTTEKSIPTTQLPIDTSVGTSSTTTLRYTTTTDFTTISTSTIQDKVVVETTNRIPNTPHTAITTQTVPTEENDIWEIHDVTTAISPQSSSTTSSELERPEESTDVKAIVVISLSAVGVIAFLLLVAFLYVMRKRQKQTTYTQRCRPVNLDAYSLDNVSVYNSVRRKGNTLRLSKRSYGNSAFEDPNFQGHPLSVQDLATFVQNKYAIYDEYKEIPTVTARVDEVPAGCEDKNRYANVVPLPETRVYLKRQSDDEKTEYINANYVKGPQDNFNYYIATQAPLESTVNDFWRMVWEQHSKVIIMATDLTENGVEKCAEYMPASVVLDNVQTYGNFQVTLKSREVKEKYAMSTIHLKHLETRTWREIIHFWYSWPESGVPTDETSLIAMLLEARSHLRLSLPEQSEQIENNKTTLNNNNQDIELGISLSNGDTTAGTIDKTRSLQRTQGPLLVHCSPGTSRTGTIIACDIVLRTLEIPPRQIDIPKTVYTVRRGRASAVQTKQQYEFIYKVGHVYATKLTGPNID